MRRLVTNAVSLIFTLILLGILIGWVRSYWVGEDITVYGLPRYDHLAPIIGGFHIRSGKGGLWLNTGVALTPLSEGSVAVLKVEEPVWDREVLNAPPHYPILRDNPQRWHWRALGFDGRIESSKTAHAYYRVYRVVFPYWVPAALAAVIPAMSLRATLRRRTARKRVRNHQCASCGYDLRASTNRCPECGQSVPATETEYADRIS